MLSKTVIPVRQLKSKQFTEKDKYQRCQYNNSYYMPERDIEPAHPNIIINTVDIRFWRMWRWLRNLLRSKRLPMITSSIAIRLVTVITVKCSPMDHWDLVLAGAAGWFHLQWTGGLEKNKHCSTVLDGNIYTFELDSAWSAGITNVRTGNCR